MYILLGKVLTALGYRIEPVSGTSEPVKQVLDESYRQPNEYLPAPLDLEHIGLGDSLLALAELLSENAHNVWASKRISQGWSYG